MRKLTALLVLLGALSLNVYSGDEPVFTARSGDDTMQVFPTRPCEVQSILDFARSKGLNDEDLAMLRAAELTVKGVVTKMCFVELNEIYLGFISPDGTTNTMPKFAFAAEVNI